LHSDGQHLTKWLLLVGLDSEAPEIACVFLLNPSQPHTQGPRLQYESYESSVPITAGLPLPTGYPDWPAQCLTFSVPEKYFSSGEIA
jgi:hypothetical protein